MLHDKEFWPNVARCVKATVPLVCVLREFDSDVVPTMGFVYHLMQRAKNEIREHFEGVERKYSPIWKKIDRRWGIKLDDNENSPPISHNFAQLHRPLHAAAYVLNPQLRFGKSFCNSKEVRRDLYACMDRMLSEEDRILADIQLETCEKEEKEFSKIVAKQTRHRRSPGISFIISF